MATTFADHLLGPDTHANRPAATAVPSGTLYSCSDHSLVYQSDGATWSTWATLGTSGAYSPGGTDVAVTDGGTGASSAATARTNLGVEIGTDVLGVTPTLTEYADTVNALGNSTGTVAPDPANGMWVTMTLTGNVTIDLTNMTAGQTLVFDIEQDGSGSHTVGFTQTVEWAGGTAFTHTGTASSRDRIVVDYDGTTYTGNVVGQAYA